MDVIGSQRVDGDQEDIGRLSLPGRLRRPSRGRQAT
jgi:hypothetical protein